MQRIAILICFGLMLGMLASAQDVRANYMPGTDFSKYHTYAWVDRKRQINGFANGWGGRGGWSSWGGGFDSFSATTSTVNIGTFVLGMYDPTAKKLVWIGAAQHAIEPSKKQEKNQERLNKGAQKLLRDLPLGRN
jgi:hypothetical protein